MPTASATDQYGSGCRNRRPVSHHGTRTAPTPPVTTNQAALVITAVTLRIPLSAAEPNAQVALSERQIREAAVPHDWSIAVRWVKVDDGHGHQKVIFWARTKIHRHHLAKTSDPVGVLADMIRSADRPGSDYRAMAREISAAIKADDERGKAVRTWLAR